MVDSGVPENDPALNTFGMLYGVRGILSHFMNGLGSLK